MEEARTNGITRLAQGLGWFSLGLGLAEIAAPRRVARLVGVRDDDGIRNTLLLLGLRELASGVGVLARPRSAGWLWTRVGGDVVDLALLGLALSSGRSRRERVAAATAVVLGVTLLDVLGSQQLRKAQPLERPGARPSRGIHVFRTITIRRAPEEVYRFWRDFQNLPRFMEHLESVQILDDRRSHWKARAPAGSAAEWDAEIIEDTPNAFISWRSLPGSDVDNVGSVRFTAAPGDRGTQVQVELRYEPPGGRLGATIAKLFGEEPGQQVQSDLRRLKQVLETGEIVRSDASVHRGPHPARPPAELVSDR